MRWLPLAAVLWVALVLPIPAHAGVMEARALLGRAVEDLRGAKAGTVEDLIVDVSDGRVLYVIVEGAGRYFTLPIHALREDGPDVRLDMRDAGEIAATDDPRLRRAARLIGQPLENPNGGRIGTIADFEFDPDKGVVERVVVAVDGGEANFPPSVLAHGRFPPLTRWQAEHPGPDASGNFGWIRREPSPERNRTHDHRWPRN